MATQCGGEPPDGKGASRSGDLSPRQGGFVGGPQNRDGGADVSFQSKMEGSAKHRHCLSRQHNNLDMVPSFPLSRQSATRPVPGSRAADSNLCCQATLDAASMTGNMRTAKAPR
jgi:hypothetical protein